MGNLSNDTEDGPNGINVPHLPALRKKVTDNQRQILNAIWNYYRNHGKWMPARVLHHQMGKDFVLANIKSLGGSIVWKMWTLDGQDAYWLSLLGVMLSDNGLEGETLLVRYFEYLRSEFMKNPEIDKITGKEIGNAMQLTNEQLRYLRELIRLGEFWGKNASFGEEWECGVPREIDDLPGITDLREYLWKTITHKYDPKMPLDPNDRTQYFLSREKKEPAREFGFIQDPKLRDQLTDDWDEAKRVREARAWKSCVILCGGILEGMLLDFLKRDEPEAKAAYQKLKVKSSPELNWLWPDSCRNSFLRYPCLKNFFHN